MRQTLSSTRLPSGSQEKLPGRLLADHAGAQHQPVRDDLGLARSSL